MLKAITDTRLIVQLRVGESAFADLVFRIRDGLPH